MKKLFVTLLTITLLLTPVIHALGETASAKVDPIVMAIGHNMPENSPRHQSLLFFKEQLEEQSGGRITVEIYPAGQLGSESDIVEQVKMGVIQATRAGQYDLVCPKMLIYTMPFLFADMDQALLVLNSDLNEKIVAGAAENNLKVLALGDSGGFRQFTNNIRPFTQPSDFEGLKMRTSGVETITKTLETLGASAFTITTADIYMSLKTNVVDGQCNAYIQIANNKIYEVQKYATECDYMLNPEGFYVNLDWFNNLDSDLQEIVSSCAKASIEKGNELINEQSVAARATIAEYCEINVLTPEQKATFREALADVYDYFINEKKLFTQEDLDAVLAVANGN